jgi:L-fucose isomerase-like protein
LGLEPETTLHDVRFGATFEDQFVWLFEISGAVPPAHFQNGYRDAVSERQPPMYFPLGDGTIKGVCKPGEIVWSRVFMEGSSLKADLGRGTALALPQQENERRWNLTTPQLPMMNVVLHGVQRDQFMARHKANHVQVAYGCDARSANLALMVKAVAFREMGIEVNICGDVLSESGSTVPELKAVLPA